MGPEGGRGERNGGREEGKVGEWNEGRARGDGRRDGGVKGRAGERKDGKKGRRKEGRESGWLPGGRGEKGRGGGRNEGKKGQCEEGWEDGSREGGEKGRVGGRKNGTLGVGKVRGNKVEKSGRKEGWSKFVKTVHCVCRVYFVIMYSSSPTTTVIVSPLSLNGVQARLYSCEKRILASSCLSVLPSA